MVFAIAAFPALVRKQKYLSPCNRSDTFLTDGCTFSVREVALLKTAGKVLFAALPNRCFFWPFAGRLS